MGWLILMIYVSYIHCTLSNKFLVNMASNWFFLGSFATLLKSQVQCGGLLKH